MTGDNMRRGFTLIEMLVVASVFSLLFLIATTVFTSVQSYQRGISAKQRLAADGRYILEAISRSVRLGTIDYSIYGNDVTVPTDKLAVIDSNGDTVCYHLDSQAVYIDDNCNGGEALTPSDLLVENFEIIIRPRSDPYGAPPVPETSVPGVAPGAEPLVSSDCRNPGGADNFDGSAAVCTCGGLSDIASCWPDQQCVDTDPTSAGEAFICQNAPFQPTVTIVLRTRSTNTQPGERAESTLQTTVTSRNYGQ